jgi:hypothetical protein
MTLGPTNWDHPDGWFGCHSPGRQKEKEGPQLREAAAYCAGRRSCDRGPGRQQQTPTAINVRRVVSSLPNGRHSAAECREIIDLAKRVSECTNE